MSTSCRNSVICSSSLRRAACSSLIKSINLSKRSAERWMEGERGDRLRAVYGLMVAVVALLALCGLNNSSWSGETGGDSPGDARNVTSRGVDSGDDIKLNSEEDAVVNVGYMLSLGKLLRIEARCCCLELSIGFCNSLP